MSECIIYISARDALYIFNIITLYIPYIIPYLLVHYLFIYFYS